MLSYLKEYLWRRVKISQTWLPKYVNKKYAETPRQIKVSDKPKGKLTMKCGLLLGIKKTSNGFGWRLIQKQEKL